MSLDEAHRLTERQLYALIPAYVRRKRWEARCLAVEIVNTLGEAMKAPDRSGQISLAELSMMGFEVVGESNAW